MDRIFLVAGAAFAFLAVGAGAFGTHALRDRVPPERVRMFETATRYTMYHALGIAPDSLIHDRERRPHRLSEGRPLVELFG